MSLILVRVAAKGQPQALVFIEISFCKRILFPKAFVARVEETYAAPHE